MHKSTRREHLKRSALAFGATILPSYLTSARAAGDRLPPSERINLACVGVGGRASKVIPSLCRDGVAEPVAFCDVDFELPKGTADILKKYPSVPRFNDFREMFDKMGDDIDAVSVVVPDHSHFCATILAMSMGKHVYVEKPLTRTFHESELLKRAEKKYGVVTQMGNQGHTGTGFDTFSKMVKLGLCNNITKMDAWKSPGLWFMKQEERLKGKPTVDPIPPSLNDYDLWCGPRKMLPFNKLYHPFSWRGFYEYGMGMLGDWGAHIVDYAHDKLNLGLPTQLKSLYMEDHNDIFYPLSSHLSMQFPARGEMPGLNLTWRDGGDFRPKALERFLKGNASGNPRSRGGGTLLYSDNSDFAILRGHHGDAPEIIPSATQKEYADRLKLDDAASTQPDHFQSFLNACKGEGKTNSPFSSAATLTQVLALGTITQYLNTDLTFDPNQKKFVGNDDANVLLNPPVRSDWEEFYRMA
ncbi:putative oxidoreductase YvaA [Planctomycetes bacterium CA13]|uniref:Putative oxidoreductase YvaA n=1 Tax=Novipirellula herctigrandis TaxID=2527986 RepID=A0A5C5YVJ7_9BACT|nr:putative oxidoreductase YvaA [Planctomycetes bacterium CA13]